KVLRSGAPFVFMSSAKQDRIGQQRRTGEQYAGAFWAVKFVTANRNQVGIELMNRIEGFLPKPLDRVGMKLNSALAARGSDFRHWLDRPNLIVRAHNGDQDGVG